MHLFHCILAIRLDPIIQWDQALFKKVNSQWINPFLDFLLPIMREPKSWIPLYIIIFGFMFYRFGWRKALPWVLFAALAPAYGDIISSHFLKGFVGRIRPCNDISLGYVRNIIHHCGGNGSFPSSHAVNHSALAAFFYFSLKPVFKKWLWLFFMWAAVISYAQVYVGVHYPVDVICGCLLGSAIGSGLAFIYRSKFVLGAASEQTNPF